MQPHFNAKSVMQIPILRRTISVPKRGRFSSTLPRQLSIVWNVSMKRTKPRRKAPPMIWILLANRRMSSTTRSSSLPLRRTIRQARRLSRVLVPRPVRLRRRTLAERLAAQARAGEAIKRTMEREGAGPLFFDAVRRTQTRVEYSNIQRKRG